MISIESITRLKKRFPKVWEIVKVLADQPYQGKVRLESAKNGFPTLKIEMDGNWKYLHSKYDPIAEAQRLIDTHEGFGENKHLFFYGVGLGYHIVEFVKRYPEQSFTLYEPNAEIMYQYMTTGNFEKIDTKYLENLYVENETNSTNVNLMNFVQNLKKEVVIVVLPSYERVFSEEVRRFTAQFLDTVFSKKLSIYASLEFSKIVSLNSIMNMDKTFHTPSILHLKNKDSMFQGKPAILIAAGPSLDYEYENIRFIKENGLAYVFSVGSSVNSLLTQGIHPDAAFTYDGSRDNKRVFSKIIEEQVQDIPLVYGSTVGFETIQDYPGRMLHFLVARDTITPYYLSRKDNDNLKFIEAFRTISTVTLQVLSMLGFNPIILVGQNFAYGKERGYAKGIEYVGELKESHLKNAIKINDVEGNEILTSPGWKTMKTEMEVAISTFGNGEIINTTRNGAHIEGTTYMTLEEVMKTRLTQPNIVSREWVASESDEYDLAYFEKKANNISKEIDDFQKVTKSFENIMLEMDQSVKTMNFKQLGKCFNKFDKAFDQMQSNKFYRLFIQPMNSIRFEFLMKLFGEVRFEQNPVLKATKVIKEFQTYLDCCTADIQVIVPLVHSMHEQIARHEGATSAK